MIGAPTAEVPADAATALSIANNVTAAAVPVKRYTLNGRVVSLDAAAKTLTVDHEAIPGFMGAMTMPYPVRNSQLLEHLSKGQQVTATVVRTGDEYWLENVGPRAR
jgi:protein SCO1/2